MASHSLGSRLKAQRESRGFTLAQISTSTKIPQTLLEGLERDDLSRWPKGLYRRAFFRSYVSALGLPTEPLVLEFARLFPDDAVSVGAFEEVAAIAPDREDPQHALALSWAGPSPAHRTLRTAAVALAEVAGVAAVGSIIGWTSGLPLLETTGAVALMYLPVVRMTAGRVPRWQFARSRRSGEAVRRPAEAGPYVEKAGAAAGEAGPPLAGETDPFVGGAGSYAGRVLEVLRPVAAQLSAAGSVLSPVARRAGEVLKAGAAGIGRGSLRAGKLTAGASSRAFDATSHAFWKAVRSAAGHAELLASRQLKRTE